MKRVFAMCAVLASAVLTLTLPARSAQFVVTPQSAKLDSHNRIVVLTLTNKDTESAVIQVTAFRWQQQHGDRLEKSDDIIAVPAVFNLPGGAGVQTIRIGLRGDIDPKRETAYRLLLHQVPNRTFVARRGLNMVMSLSLPIYTEPDVPTAAELRWSAARMDSKHVRVTVVNSGTRHAVIKTLSFSTTTGQPLELKERPIVVLPESSVTAVAAWPGSIRQLVVNQDVDGSKSRQTVAVTKQ